MRWLLTRNVWIELKKAKAKEEKWQSNRTKSNRCWRSSSISTGSPTKYVFFFLNICKQFCLCNFSMLFSALFITPDRRIFCDQYANNFANDCDFRLQPIDCCLQNACAVQFWILFALFSLFFSFWKLLDFAAKPIQNVNSSVFLFASTSSRFESISFSLFDNLFRPLFCFELHFW